MKKEKGVAGRPRFQNRTRFDCMVDLDLKRSANKARLERERQETWPAITERMLRFLEAGITTHDLTTALELMYDELESEITSEYNAGSKRHQKFLKDHEAVRQMIKLAKWAEHNRR